MAFPGQVLDNPVSGERFIFSKTAAGTGGELLAVEFVVAPTAASQELTCTRCRKRVSRW